MRDVGLWIRDEGLGSRDDGLGMGTWDLEIPFTPPLEKGENKRGICSGTPTSRRSAKKIVVAEFTLQRMWFIYSELKKFRIFSCFFSVFLLK